MYCLQEESRVIILQGIAPMEKVRFIFWQDGDAWLGHLEEFPDYMTQGDTLDDLKAHLLDLHKDLSSGQIPCVRRVAELDLS